MSSSKGTPAYWKKLLHKVLALVKLLGTLTFLLTLSCADLRWNELISITFQLNRVDVSDEEVDEMSYHESCDTLIKIQYLLQDIFSIV